jgi:chemotaxis protein methyltransferase CheR
MALAATSFDYVRTLIRDEAGIVIESGKEYLVESRLTPLARKANCADVDAFVGLAKGTLGAAIRRQMVDAMTTNDTSFFRDGAPFECLRREVLPALIEARRAERALSLWCGASSTGQEPYTIAMLIHEHFPELLTWTITFVATDLSAAALARARAGRYNQLEVSRGLPAALASRYFEQHQLEWQVSAPLRHMITFQELNLNRPWPAFPPLDIVLMRNVMIYFDVEAKKRILERVRGVLRPDGYLFLGRNPLTPHSPSGWVATSGRRRANRGGSSSGAAIARLATTPRTRRGARITQGEPSGVQPVCNTS